MAATLPKNLTREQYVYLAKLAEQAECYKEMVKFMEKLIVGSTSPGVSELTVEERNLLIVSSIEQKEEGRKNDEHVVLVKDYRSKVEVELLTVCAGILGILDSHLIPSAASGESKVFYLKMKGDYHRYLAEFKVGDERKSAAKDTMLAYKAAQDIELVDLALMHLIRLGLALNFSVFYYEILISLEKACGMAKQPKWHTSCAKIAELDHFSLRRAKLGPLLKTGAANDVCPNLNATIIILVIVTQHSNFKNFITKLFPHKYSKDVISLS
ncbi:hypothetical protein UlMin_039324 [Ulmus minor]